MKFIIISKCLLTWHLQGGVPAEGGPPDVAGQALVHSAVHLLLAVHRPEEEEAAVREDDPVTAGVSWRSLHQLPVLVPVYDGLRVSSSLEIAGICFKIRWEKCHCTDLKMNYSKSPKDSKHFYSNIFLELENVKLKKFVIRKVTTNGYTLVKLGF